MKIVKKILIGICFLTGLAIISFMILLVIEMQNHEDFQLYSNHKQETSILLDCDVFDVSAVLSELEVYIPEYNNENDILYPIYAEYEMTNRQEGTAMYAFMYSDGTGRGVALEFEIDLTEKLVVSVKYKMGYNKSAPTYPSQCFNFDGLNLQSVFDKISDKGIDAKINCILFMLANDEVKTKVQNY